MAEPRERLRTGVPELLPRLGKGHDVAGRDRRRAPIAESAQEERREFGEPGGLGKASLWVSKPHAGEDSGGARLASARRARSCARPPRGSAAAASRPGVRRGRRGAFRGSRARVRGSGIPEQDRAHAGKRRGREAPAPPDPRLLRVLRLALLGARALASRAAREPLPGRPVRLARESRSPRVLHGGEGGGGGRLSRGKGPRDVRTALWPRVAAAARRRAPGVGRPRSPCLVGDARAAREGSRVPPRRLAAQARVSDPRGRARADRVRLRPRPRLGPRGRGRADGRSSGGEDTRSLFCGIATARSRTSRPGRTSSPPASRRPT